MTDHKKKDKTTQKLIHKSIDKNLRIAKHEPEV